VPLWRDHLVVEPAFPDWVSGTRWRGHRFIGHSSFQQDAGYVSQAAKSDHLGLPHRMRSARWEWKVELYRLLSGLRESVEGAGVNIQFVGRRPFWDVMRRRWRDWNGLEVADCVSSTCGAEAREEVAIKGIGPDEGFCTRRPR